MARKGLLSMAGGDDEEESLAPSSAQPEVAPAIRRGPVGAMANDLTAHSVREIDCSRIIVDGINDRLSSEDDEIAALRQSIADHGQQVPIMVRPISERPGFFRIVYGRRRLVAIRQLGLKIKSLIRTLSDVDAILAQGQENNLRRDPSFIEKALFAQALQREGHEASVIYAALNIDRQMRSRMKSITDRLPPDVVDAIGAAPDVGRRRWLELCDLIHDNEAARRGGLQAVAEASETSSAQRFDLFLQGARASQSHVACGQRGPSAATTVKLDDGRTLGSIHGKKSFVEIKIDNRENEEFGRWVKANGEDILRKLHTEWSLTARTSET